MKQDLEISKSPLKTNPKPAPQKVKCKAEWEHYLDKWEAEENHKQKYLATLKN
jgi:hypothetical protein